LENQSLLSTFRACPTTGVFHLSWGTFVPPTTSLVVGILRVGYVLDIIDQIKSFPLENQEKEINVELDAFTP
jgi:hypothetical protein